jgi:hypothetical protein
VWITCRWNIALSFATDFFESCYVPVLQKFSKTTGSAQLFVCHLMGLAQ